MIIVTVVCLLKTFFFMRIVKSFSYIVTMIISVVADLKVFMLFFFILIIMFSMIFNVISRNPADEYIHVGYFWGNVLTTLRLSLGDFDFGVLRLKNADCDEENQLQDYNCHWELNAKQHILFWITWVIMVIFSSLIFLNFIIAEVSNSYANVKENI